ncbi:hypothetical protein ACFWN2_20790 [Lentzea sp. NPDC058436]|uniref:hypothetical protein n=1 Tax=Lentzea sp. NPDC058436 TaxID=3346499 RepID=UPI0036623CEA
MTDNRVFLPRFGAVCGVVLALSIGVPGAVEAFTGETAFTSAVIGLGTAFGVPAVLALHGHQAHASGRFGAFAFGANLLGLGVFTGVAFALNLVIFFLEPGSVVPFTQAVLKVGSLVFVAGSALFGVSMVRAKVFPAVPAWGYGIGFVLLAAFAVLPDTPLSALVHVACAVVLVWLSVAVWTARPAVA